MDDKCFQIESNINAECRSPTASSWVFIFHSGKWFRIALRWHRHLELIIVWRGGDYIESVRWVRMRRRFRHFTLAATASVMKSIEGIKKDCFEQNALLTADGQWIEENTLLLPSDCDGMRYSVRFYFVLIIRYDSRIKLSRLPEKAKEKQTENYAFTVQTEESERNILFSAVSR